MRVYLPLQTFSHIHYQEKYVNEFDIHAKLYCQLIKKGFRVLSHVRNGKSVFDLVVFPKEKNRTAIAIIEVKKNDKTNVDQELQIGRYREFSVPVIVFWDMAEFDRLLVILENVNLDISTHQEVTSLEEKHDRLRILKKRLERAQMAAFDAALYLPENKQLFNKIEQQLEQFVSDLPSK